MEKTGPILIVLALVIDVVTAAGWLMFGSNPDATVALSAGLAVGTALVYGGSWLTVLHSDISRDMLARGVIALLVHLVASTAVAFVAGSPLAAAGFAVLSAVSVAVLVPGAWRSTDVPGDGAATG